jgi:hypothetical protein
MGSMSKKNLGRVLVVITLLTFLAIPGYAQLEPMSWGFPTLVQNNSLLSFADSFAMQNQSSFSSISFPTMDSISGISDSSISDSSFPTITQVTDNVMEMYNFSYMNEQQSSVFSYPWISTDFSPVPSMGFL